jgi:hypothetical protein
LTSRFLTIELRPLHDIIRFCAKLVGLSLLGSNPSIATAEAFDHVYVIVLENHDLEGALYSGASPFLLGLSRTQGLATRYRGVTHPSLPNYIAMIGGDDFGVRDDAPSCFASDLQPVQQCHRLAGESLVDQLEAAGLEWALYAETLSEAGSMLQGFPDSGPRALYAQKHNPFAYFEQIATNPARLKKFKQLESLAADLSGKTPNFAFIVPNQCHDGHGLATCNDPISLTRDFDAFVERTVGMIRSSANWTQNSMIVVTFDEGEKKSGPGSGITAASTAGNETANSVQDDNHIATIVVTKCGSPVTSDAPSNHYSLLATIEDGFGLPRLRKAKEAATLMQLVKRRCD